MLDYIKEKWNALDAKIKAAAFTYWGTLLVTEVGLPLDQVLIPGFVRVDTAIAAVAAGIAGYVFGNDGTILREYQEDGNAGVQEV